MKELKSLSRSVILFSKTYDADSVLCLLLGGHTGTISASRSHNNYMTSDFDNDNYKFYLN